MNKKGNAMVTVIAVILILAFGAGVWAVASNGTAGFAGGSDKVSDTECSLTSPLTVNALSAIVGGTAPSSPTITVGEVGNSISTAITSGTTALVPGKDYVGIVSKADYIDTKIEFTHQCGGTTLDVEMFQSTSDNPSITIKDEAGATVTDNVAGGAVNLTVVGSTVEGKIKFVGTAFESSGKALYVMEFPAGSEANISTVSLGSLAEKVKPKVYTTINAGSKVVVFEVPAIEGGVVREYDLLISLEGGKTLTGGVYTDWFNMQEFIDDDTTVITEGVEDSDGTAKYENTIDRDLYISA